MPFRCARTRCQSPILEVAVRLRACIRRTAQRAHCHQVDRMRKSSLGVVTVVCLFTSALPANADAILLQRELLGAVADISWLDPLGVLQRMSDERVQSPLPINTSSFLTIANIGQAPPDLKPRDGTELVAFVDYRRSLDTIEMLMRGDIEDCNSESQCLLAAQFDGVWDFKVDGDGTKMTVGSDTGEGGLVVRDLQLYDVTTRSLLVDIFGNADSSRLEFDLLDQHVYRLVTNFFSVGNGDKETQFDVRFFDATSGASTVIQAAPVPEPATLLLLGAGAAALARRRRLRSRPSLQLPSSYDFAQRIGSDEPIGRRLSTPS